VKYDGDNKVNRLFTIKLLSSNQYGNLEEMRKKNIKYHKGRKFGGFGGFCQNLGNLIPAKFNRNGFKPNFWAKIQSKPIFRRRSAKLNSWQKCTFGHAPNSDERMTN
jgi:hypothetical protein